MTPRGHLDERCFTDWLKGCVVIVGIALVFITGCMLSGMLLWWLVS